jgi:hypothetical protein
MKVYSLPEELEFEAPDYTNYNREREEAREAAHKEKIKEWLVEQGFDGDRTGETVSFPVADGYAQYMFADKGRSSYLLHLPYGDAWHYRDVEFLPKTEIVKRIEQQKNIASIFASR